MKEFENHHHYSEQNGHRMRSSAKKQKQKIRRAGIETEDDQLSQDWVEAGKLIPKRKVIDYPKGLPRENNHGNNKTKISG